LSLGVLPFYAWAFAVERFFWSYKFLDYNYFFSSVRVRVSSGAVTVVKSQSCEHLCNEVWIGFQRYFWWWSRGSLCCFYL